MWWVSPNPIDPHERFRRPSDVRGLLPDPLVVRGATVRLGAIIFEAMDGSGTPRPYNVLICYAVSHNCSTDEMGISTCLDNKWRII